MKHIIFTIGLTILTLLTSTAYAGDAAAGKTVYMQCQACHGVNGEGNEAMKGPKLAGQHAWYIESSLKKFKSGARGAGDSEAAMMVPFSMMLDDTKMADVAAYLASLK